MSESDVQAPQAPTDKNVHMRVRGVEKTYGTHKVLQGVDVDILRGAINVIIGASGSGKTVLLRQLTRLEQPDAGHIWVDDVDIVPLGDVELLPIRRKFGVVFQMSALFDSMNVFDNVAFPLREHKKFSSRELKERVMQSLASLGVDHAVQKMPAELSGGMRKRVAVARALVLEPQILFYDEPTTGLDPVTARTVDELIEEAKERFGVTSVVISHDMTSVFHIAERIHLLHKGHMEAGGTPQELVKNTNPVVKEFLQASGVSAATQASSS